MKLAYEMRALLVLADKASEGGGRLKNIPQGSPVDEALQRGWLRRMLDGFGGYMITPAGLAVLNGQ